MDATHGIATGLPREAVTTDPIAIGIGNAVAAWPVAIGLPANARPAGWDVDPLSLALADAALDYHANRHPVRKWIDRIFR